MALMFWVQKMFLDAQREIGGAGRPERRAVEVPSVVAGLCCNGMFYLLRTTSEFCFCAPLPCSQCSHPEPFGEDIL